MKLKLPKEIRYVLIREIVIFALILFISYFFELIFYLFHKGPSGPSLPFWKDRYAYEIWNNSLRENAQILRYFGYPLALAVRFIVWGVKNPEVQRSAKLSHESQEIKSFLDNIAEEINLGRRIEEVIYRPEYRWYIVRFRHPPSCLISKEAIDNYINSEGKIGRKEIVDSLLHRHSID